MKTTPIMSPEVRVQRAAAVRFARNSVRLEGFPLSAEAEALNRRYLNGEITGAEHTAALLALAGLPSRS